MKVLLLLADALRADHLGCYGYRYPTSPNLDRLSERGVRFSEFFAPSIPTQPAHTSIFSGQHSVTHHIVAHKAQQSALRASTPWLPRLLRHHGVMTAAVDTLADQGPWFGQGWDEYHNPRRPGQLLDAEHIQAVLLPWLEAHRHDDWFCFVHYWDPHSPYLPPAPFDDLHDDPSARPPGSVPSLDEWRAQPSFPFAERWQARAYGDIRDLDVIRARYDGEISYLDHTLGQLFESLERSGLDQETVVMLTADHGEVMYDHPGFFDHAGLYDDTLHIPLIMAGPGVRPATVVDGMHQHVDLAPTILELFGLPTGEGMAGASLAPGLRGEPLAGEEELFLTEATWEGKWGVRTEEWKLIKVLDAGVHGVADDELYHLGRDPGEQTNVIGLYPDVADRLELRLRRWWEAGLGGDVDPLRRQVRVGLPAVAWVAEASAARELSQTEWQTNRYRPSGVGGAAPAGRP